ncbi:MAG: PDZ domain-containing protein [Armatimonadetes bacterium]|nr:PDZ domain-containing protein [Anaerolineae bacterium]
MKANRLVLPVVLLVVLTVGVGVLNAQKPTTQGDPQPFLGVAYEAAPDAAEGVVIVQVVPGSPAEAAGLLVDDLVTAVDGEPVDTESFVTLIQAKAVGDEVTLTITRNGDSQDLTATLTEAPMRGFGGRGGMFGRGGRDGDFGFDGDFTLEEGFGFLDGMRGMGMLGLPGVQLAILTEQTAVEYNVPQTSGIYVVRVLTDSAAAEAGLKGRDVITAINGEAIESDAALRDLLGAFTEGDTVTLTVLRDEATLEIELSIEALPFRFGFRGPRLDAPGADATPTAPTQKS